jgi:hypothetical protein
MFTKQRFIAYYYITTGSGKQASRIKAVLLSQMDSHGTDRKENTL